MTAMIRKLFNKNVETTGSYGTSRSYWDILYTNLFNFFHIILFAVGAILVAFGRYNDAFITVIAAFVSILIRTVQEIRAKRQLDRIAVIVRPTATVVRNGAEETIDAAALVKGDVIRLRAGDQAQADGTVTAPRGHPGTAEMDESLLSGESDLVRKQQGDPIYSGSFCVSGDLRYTADAVGSESMAHQFTTLARAYTKSSTPLQQEISLIIRLLMVLTVFMALIFYVGGFLADSGWLYFVAGSAVLIGLVPYGLFLIISLAYTLSAVKIAGEGAIVQHTNAVELLKHVDVLCVDKTGTLTTNALQVKEIQPLGTTTAGVTAEADLKRRLGDFVRSTTTTNATGAAIFDATEGRRRKPVDEVPFISARKWSALAFDAGAENGGVNGVFVLGAPEMLLPYLAAESDVARMTEQAQAWADQGLRVLVFAHNPHATALHAAAGEPALPALQPLGLIGLSDELRPYARETLSQFAQLGIQLKVISGDNPHTVAALVKQLGVVDPNLVTGAELAAMGAAEFEQTVEEATVFGRIAPEQKAQIVDALIQQGHYVAMIGDGVNDILALKRAKLGIALQSGSNATRNVADMVLLNDSFAALAPALTEGHRIINGLTNALYLTLTRSFTYAFVIMGVLMAGLDFPFEPAQTGVTLLTVGLPAFFLTLWARPQAKVEPLLTLLARFVLPVAMWSMLIGVILFAFVFFHFGAQLQDVAVPADVIARFERYTGLTYQVDQQFGFTAARILAQTALSIFLTLCALLLLLFLEPPVKLLASWRTVSSDWRPTWLALGLIVLFVTGLYTPPLAGYLGFIPPPPGVWLLDLGGLLVWASGLWLFWRKRWMDRLLALET